MYFKLNQEGHQEVLDSRRRHNALTCRVRLYRHLAVGNAHQQIVLELRAVRTQERDNSLPPHQSPMRQFHMQLPIANPVNSTSNCREENPQYRKRLNTWKFYILCKKISQHSLLSCGYNSNSRDHHAYSPTTRALRIYTSAKTGRRQSL